MSSVGVAIQADDMTGEFLVLYRDHGSTTVAIPEPKQIVGPLSVDSEEELTALLTP